MRSFMLSPSHTAWYKLSAKDRLVAIVNEEVCVMSPTMSLKGKLVSRSGKVTALPKSPAGSGHAV